MQEARDDAQALRHFEAELELVEVLVHQVSRLVGAAVDLDELRSFGREGLLDAARRFDPSRGVPFRAYANYRVKGAIFDGVRKMSRLPRRVHERIRGLHAAARVGEGAVEDLTTAPQAPIASGGPSAAATKQAADAALADHLGAVAAAMAVGLIAHTVPDEDGDIAPASFADDPESAVAHSELMDLVGRAIAELPHAESELVRRHYLEGERFDHVAADLGLSKSWASRLHTRAMGRLTKRLRGTI